MAKFSFFRISEANAAIDAADQALAPALAKAGITSITVAGKVMAVADAPLASRISALLAAAPPVGDAQSISDVLVSNETIGLELEKTKTELALAQTTVSSLTRENATLTTKLATAQTGVDTLTIEKADLTNRLEASTKQFAAVQRDMNARETELSQLCLSAGCIELKDATGKPLAKEATDEQRMEAANRIPHADKMKSYQGAVNAAMARTGITFATIPAGSTNAHEAAKKPMTATEKCLADVADKQRRGLLPAPAQR